MKKHYALIFLLLTFVSTGYSQFYEGFEGTSIPDPSTGDWNLNSGVWNVSNNGLTGVIKFWEPTENIVCVDGRSAYVNRENAGLNSVDEDWLASPPIALDDSPVLSFFTHTTITGDQGTFYKLMVSTTSQTDHSTYVPVDVWSETDMNAHYNICQRKIVPLPNYANQTVFIAFVRSYTQPVAALSGDRWVVDQVEISNDYYNFVEGFVGYAASAAECPSAIPANTQLAFVDENYALAMMVNGNYERTLIGQNVEIFPMIIPQYFDITPPNYTYNFTSSNNSVTADFCIAPKVEAFHDVKLDLLPYHSTLMSFSLTETFSDFRIIIKNVGNRVESGTVNLAFDDTLMDFEAATILPSAVTMNNVQWQFTDLPVMGSMEIHVYMVVNHPTDTPPVNNGDLMYYSATATITDEQTPVNNTDNLVLEVVSSFDPNDKTISQGPSISPEQAEDYLDYVIRFQNTGNGPASLVKIRDMIQETLDLGTLEPISASHPYRTELFENGIEFIFEDIALPPAETDEPNSHGYIAFRIKPQPNLPVGSVVENRAHIYFDYNYPIITNTTTTTITVLGLENVAVDNFKMFPNPTTGEVSIDNAIPILSVGIHNMLGQLLRSEKGIGTTTTLNVSSLDSGTYLIQIETELGKTTKKLIKI